MYYNIAGSSKSQEQSLFRLFKVLFVFDMVDIFWISGLG